MWFGASAGTQEMYLFWLFDLRLDLFVFPKMQLAGDLGCSLTHKQLRGWDHFSPGGNLPTW